MNKLLTIRKEYAQTMKLQLGLVQMSFVRGPVGPSAGNGRFSWQIRLKEQIFGAVGDSGCVQPCNGGPEKYGDGRRAAVGSYITVGRDRNARPETSPERAFRQFEWRKNTQLLSGGV
jgi:hypothetical protein